MSLFAFLSDFDSVVIALGAAAGATPIRIIATVEHDEGKEKKRLNVYIDPELADLISKLARLNSISMGEIIEEAVKESFISAPIGSGRWRLGKR